MSPATPTEPERKRLLIVDDEHLNRDLLRRVLQAHYECTEAEDADSALVQLETNGPFDLILCDQLMPGRAGTELAVEVRDRWPQLPFVLITGYDDDAQVRDAKAKGIVRKVVAKPWTARVLRALLDAELASSPSSSPSS